jgi:hypothetical protein
MSQTTTVRLPTKIIKRADKCVEKFQKVDDHEFFSAVDLASGGFNRSVIIRWAVDIGFHILEKEYRNALTDLAEEEGQA